MRKYMYTCITIHTYFPFHLLINTWIILLIRAMNNNADLDSRLCVLPVMADTKLLTS